jgi:hypothetical protein
LTSTWVFIVLSVIFLALVFIHRSVARRYLDEYVAKYQRLPDRSWVLHSDKDATVERWRRRRLAVMIPELVVLVLAITQVPAL